MHINSYFNKLYEAYILLMHIFIVLSTTLEFTFLDLKHKDETDHIFSLSTSTYFPNQHISHQGTEQ